MTNGRPLGPLRKLQLRENVVQTRERPKLWEAGTSPKRVGKHSPKRGHFVIGKLGHI